jgi:hypothetical protein
MQLINMRAMKERQSGHGGSWAAESGTWDWFREPSFWSRAARP